MDAEDASLVSFLRRESVKRISDPLICCVIHSIYLDMDEYLQMFGRSRPADTITADPSTHPLLSANARIAPSAPGPAHHHPRGAHRRSLLRGPMVGHDGGGNLGHLASMIQDLIGEDSFQMVEQMMIRSGGSGEAYLELRSAGGPPISVTQLVQARHNQRHSAAPATDASQDPTRLVAEFTPVSTPQRWIDEGKMTQGRNAGDRVAHLTNFIILSLLPEAREKEATRQAKETEERKKRDAENEAAAIVESESTPAPPAVDTGSDNVQPLVSNETEAPADSPPAAVSVPTPGQTQDVDMVDASPPAASNSLPNSDTSEDNHEADSPEAGESSAPSPTNQDAEAGPSAASVAVERVTISVHGETIDITDTGIDVTFLEALPDDMRQEVINQHMRERRAAEPVARPEESQISPEFLDALPPEIRAEILQQEQDAIDRARRERERTTAPAVQQGGPSDMDSASFLASLDPALRQAVLMDQDDGFLQTLPSALLAEAGALLSGDWRQRDAQRAIPPADPSAPSTSKPKPVVVHESIQLLDKSGVATLVRLLFFPQVLRKTAMHKVLANLCENSKTRTDLFNLLLSILQDGAVDVGAVDRSFAQLSFRPGKTHASTSKTPTKARADSYHSLADSSSSTPNLITQRCLDALAYIVNVNESAAYYFLSEQDVLPGAKRPSSRKGKGKEKPLPTTHFPVSLLLALLDREHLLKSPAMMAMVAQLLATVTKPLTTLKDAETTPAPDQLAPPSASASAPETSNVQVDTTTNSQAPTNPTTSNGE